MDDDSRILGGETSNIYVIFIQNLGKIPILMHIFQMG